MDDILPEHVYSSKMYILGLHDHPSTPSPRQKNATTILYKNHLFLRTVGFRFGIRFNCLWEGKTSLAEKMCGGSAMQCMLLRGGLLRGLLHGALHGARCGGPPCIFLKKVDCVAHCHAILQDQVYQTCVFLFWGLHVGISSHLCSQIR